MENNMVEALKTTMEKIKTMINTQMVVGEPILTPDGVTLIPVSRAVFGFASGGTDFSGKRENSKNFGGGSGAGVKVEPVAFLVVKDGVTRMLPVTVPAATTVDRLIEMAPEVMDRVQSFVDKKKAGSEF